MLGDDALKLVRDARRASAAAAAAAASSAAVSAAGGGGGGGGASAVAAAIAAAAAAAGPGGTSSADSATASAAGLSPYNEEVVRSVVRETVTMFQETRALLQQPGMRGDMKVVIYHAVMQRNKRCLLAYHMQRVLAVQSLCWELGTLPPPSVRALLSKPEVDYMRSYNALITDYKAKYLDLDLMATSLPPKELFVEVRVVYDCGVIETEQGAIHLRRNSQHFVRRTDVEHLVKQGFLVHLD